SFITEALPFPSRKLDAIITVLTLPVHMTLVVLTSSQTVWEVILIGFIMECGIILATIVYLVFEKIAQGSWNGCAIIILLGTAGVLLAAGIPLLLTMIENNWWVYLLSVATAGAGIAQTIYHYKFSPKPMLVSEKFIALGVGAFIVLPLAAILVRNIWG
ncbi:MAG TPA: hypothetical protein VJC18_01615, partial [bacterium]|nr:hypothetical protein [bacterium]